MQPHADCILYADDSTLTVQRGTLEETLVLKDKLISIASEWCTTNELILNTNKTEKLLQTLKTHSFENPQSVKFLGVHVDGTLNFSMHARYICKKISSNIYVLRRLSNSLTKQTLVAAYYALVHSVIQYGILIWGNCAAATDVFALQRRAVRIIDSVPYRDECRKSFRSLKILTLPSMYVLECILFAKTNYAKYKIQSELHSYNTRNKNNIRVDYCRLSKTQNNHDYLSQKIFNLLPENVQMYNKQ
uniref:Reverse transcriptase domain-containing protein n=2 Tax=Photinus pyralis TaxID=7054 RepID=A0A1Y1LXB7_PHOPY